jgi:hypothetical protein
MPPESTPRSQFERSVETQDIVNAMAALEIGERISTADLAKRASVPVELLSGPTSRQHRCREIVEKEHHVIIVCVRGFGFERLGQDDVDAPARLYMKGAGRKARRSALVIGHGVTDWEALSPDKKAELTAIRSQAAVISAASSPRAEKRLQTVATNHELDIGRSLDALREK